MGLYPRPKPAGGSYQLVVAAERLLLGF
jgi:hypothetical protein